jgi:DNA polymerase-3 subunit delta'
MSESPVPDFNVFLGNSRAVQVLRRAIEQDRLPHAMIFAGPAGVGKRTLALMIGQLLNCTSPQGGAPCGKCSSCFKIAASSHSDVLEIRPDGAYIKIEQIRGLISEIAYQPFEGQYRVVVLDGADQMRPEAANSLLKTLEEPASRTVLILITANPYLLLGTIRSRARILHFGQIPHEQIVQFLIESRGKPAADAELAALFSQGSLAAALSFDSDRHRAARAQALRFMNLWLKRGSFAEASAMAASLGKDKEGFQVWLELATVVLQDLYYAHVAPERISQTEISRELQELSENISRQDIVAGFQAFSRLKRSMANNVNRQIALEALFLKGFA